MTGIDLSKQQALHAAPKVIQQNFTGNLNRKNNRGQNINDNTTIFFIIEEAKKNYFRF